MCFSHNPAQPSKITSRSLEDGQRISKALLVVFFNLILKKDPVAQSCMTQAYVDKLIGKQIPKITWSQRLTK